MCYFLTVIISFSHLIIVRLPYNLELLIPTDIMLYFFPFFQIFIIAFLPFDTRDFPLNKNERKIMSIKGEIICLIESFLVIILRFYCKSDLWISVFWAMVLSILSNVFLFVKKYIYPVIQLSNISMH